MIMGPTIEMSIYRNVEITTKEIRPANIENDK